MNDLIKDWEKWASTANKAENGWQSDYEKWDEIISFAERIMTRDKLTSDELSYLEFVYEISSEGEELIDFGKDHFQSCRNNLSLLSNSHSPEVRWQIYETLKEGNEETDKILLRALKCEFDRYALKRAILSSLERNLVDKKTLQSMFASLSDKEIQEIISKI